MVEQVISGFQTGGDRGGSYAGEACGLMLGGWVPLGRRADDGPISLELMQRFSLKEHPSSAYPPRTEQNVRMADATVLFGNMSSPGCKLTIKLCKLHGKWFKENPTVDELRSMLCNSWALVRVLNVAGNRERTNPGIYQLTFDTLVEALSK